MSKLPVFLTTMTAMIILSACQQDPSAKSFESGPTAEPADATFKDFGDYVLHFSSMSTSELGASIARDYNISRSKNRALLTVSIIRKEEASLGVSVPGEVTATANNLTGQVKNLVIRQIKEGDAYYYIGDVSVANKETLVFNIDVIPESEVDNLSVRFMRQYFTE